MEVFIEAYVKRGDGAVSEFLDFYVSTASDGLAKSSGARQDFVDALHPLRRAERR